MEIHDQDLSKEMLKHSQTKMLKNQGDKSIKVISMGRLDKSFKNLK